jgi:hypothetical protein
MSDGLKGLSRKEKQIVREHNERMRQRGLENSFAEQESRGRSISIGTAFGGVLEVSMRRGDGSHTWIVLQPVEVVELINQMAAGIGCHLHLQPRKDFASWRSWNHTEEELEHFRGQQRSVGEGHPPHAKAIVDGGYGSSLPAPEEQAGMPTPILEKKHDEVMAIKAPKQRRKSKRGAASS